MLLRTFGGLVLEGSDFTRPKLLLLLTYLALESPQDRRHLAELFWPEAADHLKSLTVALTRLRQGAPGATQADDERVWAAVETDAQRFLTLLEQGKLEKALELYRGPFLQGFYLRRWSVELEAWVYKTREFLAERVRGALLELAEREAAQARFEEASKHAEAAYTLKGAPALEPEELSRLYTLLCAGESPHAGEGRKEASAFDISLVSSAEEARERLRRVGASPTPHNLPVRGTAFVGRDLELTEVATLLLKPHCRLLSLVGPAGVGKTRLAFQVAQEQLSSGSFRDGIYQVSLAPLTASGLIPATVADALQLEPQGSDEALQQVIDHIGDKNLLLIFDNFEHLMDGATITSELVGSCPNLKLLVTSRERLNVEEEHIFPVAGLPFPKDTGPTPEEAQRFDAVRLFLRRAKRAHPDFELTQDNLPDVLKICRLVEGLPLGLELSAVWVRTMSCQDIAREIDKNLDLLTTPTRNIHERHRSLRSAFEHSWNLLSPKEQAVLRKLSVFRGGFRREAAGDVAGATIPVLASLVDKSLLRIGPAGRYHRHRLLHHYSQEKLAEHPRERVRTEEKHGQHYFEFLRGWTKALLGGKQKEALLAIEEELENLRTAWRWAVSARRLEELRQAIEPLALFFKIRGRRQEGIAFFTQAAAKGSEKDSTYRTVLGNVLTAQARLYQDLGRYREAYRLAERGLALLRSSNDSQGMIRGLDTLGRVAWRSGDYLKAKGYWDEAMDIAYARGDHKAAAMLLGDIAMIEQELGHYPEAERRYLEAVAKNREQENHLHVIRNLHNLGEVYFLTDNIEKAQRLWEEGLGLAEEIDFRGLIPYFYANLGLAAFELEKYQQAQAWHQKALRRARESGDTSLEASILARLSRVATATSALSQAQGYVKQALKLSWEIQDRPDVLASLISLAELQTAQGKLVQAASLFSLALHHRTTGQYDRERAQRLLKALADRLTPEAKDKAIARGKDLRLREVVEELVYPRAERSAGAQ